MKGELGQNKSLLFITNNKNKFIEVHNILKSYEITVEWMKFNKLEIQSSCLSDIALYAARHAFNNIKRPLIVEDDGLFINSLNGFPGPFSSYIYNTIGINGILKLMEGVENRDCLFESAVAFTNGVISKVFMGCIYGKISYEARGSGGFGFDPIFIPINNLLTFAEMSLDQKCAISHRGAALRSFGEWFLKNFKYINNVS